MALNIKNERAERLARELAQTTGESITDAVLHALEDRLSLVQPKRGASADEADLQRILREYRRLPVLDPRSPRGIADELYDADGLPT